MQNRPRLAELQDQIVMCLARTLEQAWDYFIVNFERQEVERQEVTDTLAAAFQQRSPDVWNRAGFIMPVECGDLLSKLHKLMADSGDAWTSCLLEVHHTGKYRFSFSYDPPKRLNGRFDDEALLKAYLPRPL